MSAFALNLAAVAFPRGHISVPRIRPAAAVAVRSVGINEARSFFGQTIFAAAAPRRTFVAQPPRAQADSAPAHPTVAQVSKKLTDALAPKKLQVIDNAGDASHIVIDIVSSQFEGKNVVARHRMIYKAIWDEMQSNQVHAVDSIIAKTPAEAGL
eukprot:tig00020684_g12896.t1